MQNRKLDLKDIIGGGLLIISFLILSRMFFYCLSEDIWYDEVFSVGMIKHTYGQIAHFTAQDVHPPFYYWYLKAFVDLGNSLFPKLNPVILAKLSSLLPMFGIWIMAVSKIRKSFGWLTAGIFTFCVYSMPQLLSYGVEIRMYSFALFFVTLAFFAAYEICITKSLQAFVCLFFCGIITAYTQYFACIGIVMLYLTVGIYLWKDTKARTKWLCNIGLSVLCYLPWLPTVIRQFTTVHENYWIPPLTWRSLAGCIKYIYLPSGGYSVMNYVLAAAMIAATLLTAVLFFRKKGKVCQWFTHEGILFVLMAAMLGGTIFIGVGVSILVSPVFVYRYMIPCLGAFWFCFALLLGKCDYKKVWIPILLLTLFVGYTNVNGVFWEENKKVIQMKETQSALEQIGEEDILVFNFNHLQGVIGYYKNNDSYLLYQKAEDLLQDIYRSYGYLESNSDIQEVVKTGRKVWFLGSFHSREEIVEEFRQMGLEVTECGSFLLERYWFNLYGIEDK